MVRPVTLRPDGIYQVGRSDPAHDQHHRGTAASPDGIARDLTSWLAARDYPNRPARTSETDF